MVPFEYAKMMYEREIAELYKLCNVRSFPIDCFAIIKSIGFSVKTYKELVKTKENLLLLHSVSSDAFTYFDKKLIAYNGTLYRRRIRFTLMHEVGHIILNTDSEDEADAFASSALAPLPVVARYGFDCDTICRIFDVSVAMANRIISESRDKTISDPEGILDYFNQCEVEDARKRYEIRARRCRRRAAPITEADELRLAKHDLELFLY